MQPRRHVKNVHVPTLTSESDTNSSTDENDGDLMILMPMIENNTDEGGETSSDEVDRPGGRSDEDKYTCSQ